MQTRPRPPVEPDQDQDAAIQPQTELKPVASRDLKRWLNFGLAVVGLGLAFGYVSRGWSAYSYVPGGRKTVLGLLALVELGLVAGRVWVGLGRAGLTEAGRQVWRSGRVREAVPVGLIVVIAFGVRLWGVNFGLPYLEHVDEWNVAERGLHIVQTGNFDPYDYRHPGLAEDDRQAFTYPTFYTYLQTGVYVLRFLQGVSAGQYSGTSVLASPLVDADFYLWGRALTALVGAGTVLLIYLLGKRLYGRAVGLVAALFLTFFYLHALNSHWITTDVPSGFMAVLPYLFLLPILAGRDERRPYLLTGLLAGLAIATKYNNGLILLPLLLAHGLGRPVRRWASWNLPLALVATFVGFLIGAPFVFFHLPAFLNDLATLINHYQNVGHAGYEATDNWFEYLRFMWDENAAIVALGLVGIVILAARHRRQDLVLLSFPLLTYLQLTSYKVNFSRNLMPVVPFLALFAAFGLVTVVRWGIHRIRGQRSAGVRDQGSAGVGDQGLEPNLQSTHRATRWAAIYNLQSPPRQSTIYNLQSCVIGLLAILSVLGPALAIMRYDAYNALPTSRARATAWIEANLPTGSKLWLEPLSTDLLPRSAYRLEGGTGVLAHPTEWYAANGYHYLVLSEAYYKEAAQSGNAVVQASYRALTDGPLPAGLSLVKDFKKSDDEPGARIVILSTGLPLLTTPDEVARGARPLSLEFGGSLRLIGWQIAGPAVAGSTVVLSLYWQSLRPVGQNYTTFLHLLNESGQTVAQLDLPPFAGTRPTSTWLPGQTLRDDYPLGLPASLPPGSYRLTVGLYQPPGGPRLALADGQTEVTVGTLVVEKKS